MLKLFILISVLIIIIFYSKSRIVYKSIFNGHVVPNNNYILDSITHNPININTSKRKLSDDFVISIKNMLIKLQTILDNNNIPFWLAGGSLIGAIRHDGFIPWDDDVDIFIDISYKEKLIRLLKDDFRISLVQNHILKLYLPNTIDGSPPFLDIFFIKEVDNKIMKCLDINCNTFSNKEVFNVQDIYPLKKIKFEKTLNLWIPNNSIKILKEQYGNDVLTNPKVYPPHSMYTWLERGKSFF